MRPAAEINNKMREGEGLIDKRKCLELLLESRRRRIIKLRRRNYAKFILGILATGQQISIAT